MTPELYLKEVRFYEAELNKKVGKAKTSWLKRFGAFTRRSARSSMKKRPKAPTSRYGELVRVKRGRNVGKERWKRGQHSKPGEPPFYGRSNTGVNFRDIRFEAQDDSVSVSTITRRSSKKISKSPPVLQERGGTAKIRRTKKRMINGFNRPSVHHETARFPKRPFMDPAGVKALVDLNRKARDSIK